MNDGIPVQTPARRGQWMLTFSGRQFWPLDPRADEISIQDIAHSLSNQCRFAGHTSEFYSVAQHCVLASRLVAGGPVLQLDALLHDATEAYLVDLPRPVKNCVSEYAQIEQTLARRIEYYVLDNYGIEVHLDDPAVKVADELALMTEARDLMPRHNQWPLSPGHPDKILPLAPRVAREQFLERWYELVEACR